MIPLQNLKDFSEQLIACSLLCSMSYRLWDKTLTPKRSSLAFQRHVSRHRTMPDGCTIEILLQTEQIAPDVTGYPLTLDQDDPDANRGATVSWLERKKGKLSPHVFGKIVLEEQ